MNSSALTRRRALASPAAGLLILKPATVFGSAANSAIALGLVGCGSRGNWIAPFFTEFGARWVALADLFPDSLERTRLKLGVAASRAHAGLQAGHELIHSALDGVVLQTPPVYFPAMTAEAVSAGKHVFLAKPVAVDVPGALSIQSSGQRARGRLTCLVDFQLRARSVFQEAAARYQRGETGRTILGQAFYHSTSIRPRPVEGLSPGAAMLRNWYFYRALAGDTIVSRDIHVIDAVNFFLRARPEKAFGSGGHTVRPAFGDTWDRFLVQFWYPGGVQVDFCSTEFASGFNDMCARLIGSAGTLDAHYNGLVRIAGERPWIGTGKDDTFTGGAVANVRAFIDSIREGAHRNNVEESVESTLTSILGRTAAYQNRTVTWEELLRSTSRYQPPAEL